MNQRSKRVVMIGGAILAVVALTLPKLGSLRGTGRSEDTVRAPRDAKLPVRLYVVQPEKFGEKVVTIGSLLAKEEVDIRSEISGKVERIYLREGGRVKKGELLLKINDAELQAQLSRAQYREKIAAQQAERQHQLFEKQLASQQDYDDAANQLNIAKAETQLIQAQVAKTSIRAPFDGVVGLRYVSEGSYISPTSRITTLQDNTAIKVDFSVPEKYAGALKTGDKVTFTVPQNAAQEFTGTIYAFEPKIDPATRTLHVRALSPNPGGALLSGAFADVAVALKEKEALMIPSEALIPELKRHKVFLCKDGRAISQAVKVGLRTDAKVEIVEGVQAGDSLITSAILQLRPGMAVQPAQNQ